MSHANIARIILLAALPSISLLPGSAWPGEWPGAGSLRRGNVFVELEIANAWGPTRVSRLAADGSFTATVMGRDTTTTRGQVTPASALAVINQLLALDFFAQPAHFGSRHRELDIVGADRFAYRTTDHADTDRVRIRLHLAGRSHEVVLVYPAPGAPDALRRWVLQTRRFLAMHGAGGGRPFGPLRIELEIKGGCGPPSAKTIQLDGQGQGTVRITRDSWHAAPVDTTIQVQYETRAFLDLFNRFLAERFFDLPDRLPAGEMIDVGHQGELIHLRAGTVDAGRRVLTITMDGERKSVSFINTPPDAPAWLRTLGTLVETFAERYAAAAPDPR